jgi:hypothetical protein
VEGTRIAQITIKYRFEFTRKSIISDLNKYTGDINAIDLIASTKINSCLRKENKNWYVSTFLSAMKEWRGFTSFAGKGN